MCRRFMMNILKAWGCKAEVSGCCSASYGDYFAMLTAAAVVMVIIAQVFSFVIHKMLDSADRPEEEQTSASQTPFRQ